MALETQRFYQFGAFRLDAEQRVLFRNEQPVPMAPKAIEMLTVLVKDSGRVVTKKELMDRVWPDTFVEEGNIAFHVSVIRKTLGDERKNGNRFIENVPTRGYRFVAPIVGNGMGSHVTAEQALGHTAVEQRVSPKRDRMNVLAYFISAAVLVAALGVMFVLRPLPTPRVISYTAVTSDRQFKPSWLLADDHRVYFAEMNGDQQTLLSVSAQGGAIIPVTPTMPGASALGVAVDEPAWLLEKGDGALWTVGPPTDLPRRLGELVTDGDARWSPDRRKIVYMLGHDILVAKSDGSESRKITSAPGWVSGIRWSPDGRKLRFSVLVPNAELLPSSIWEVGVDGSHLHALFSGWHSPPSECCGDWTPDGRYFVFQSPTGSTGERSDLWATREQTGPFSKQTQPMKLTSGLMGFRQPVFSADGKRLFALSVEDKGELVVWDGRRKEFVPYLHGRSALWVTFSRDHSWIAYVDFDSRTLWRMKADGNEARQLAFEPMEVDGLSISPDGKSIAFRSRKPGSSFKIYLIPASGGRPQAMLPDLDREEGIPSWSPDGQKIVFGDVPSVFGDDDGTHSIRVYDLQSHELSSLPESAGLWTARWSPDGRYICALTIDSRLQKRQSLKLYDVRAREWRDLGVEHVSDPVWSHDSSYLYFGGEGPRQFSGIFRVRISDGSEDKVSDFGITKRAYGWAGLTPDDAPIVLRNIGTEEVYAIDVEWP
jgi:Tol biopolymer transport system component/DNA-binding winged helix-turn-helix (wHTH) protein